MIIDADLETAEQHLPYRHFINHGIEVIHKQIFEIVVFPFDLNGNFLPGIDKVGITDYRRHGQSCLGKRFFWCFTEAPYADIGHVFKMFPILPATHVLNSIDIIVANNMGPDMLEFKLLLLVIVANGAPVLAWDIFKQHYAHPVDFGIKLPDGSALFGPAKTWRGLIASLLAAAVCAELLGLPASTGLMIAIAAMMGDLLSSFIKRRLGIESSGKAPGLDQIPESFLPLLAVKSSFDLDWKTLFLLVAFFFILEISISPLLYRLRIRKHPY